MAKQGMSPIEAIAKRLVKPTVVKQTTPPPTPTVPGALDTLIASTTTTVPKVTTTTIPQTPVIKTPSAPSALDALIVGTPTPKPGVFSPGLKGDPTTPPGGVSTTPIFDPEIQRARRVLEGQAKTALRVGVDPKTVESIRTGQGDPDRGFLGAWNDIKKGLKATYNLDVIPGEGEFRPFPKAVNLDVVPGKGEFKPVKAAGSLAKTGGSKLLMAAMPALDKLDFGLRMVTSLVKEVGDEGAVWLGNRGRGEQGFRAGPGGFSWNDFINQGFAGEFGLGETYKADDPAIVAEAKASQITPEQLATLKNREQRVSGGEFFQEIKNPYANQLLGLFADVFLDPLTFLTGPGGIAKTGITRATLKGNATLAAKLAKAEADRLAASVTKKAAEEAISIAKANGDTVAEAAARKAAKDATQQIKYSLKVTSNITPIRTAGRTSNQALAEAVTQIRDDAQRYIDGAAKDATAGIGTIVTPEQLASAQRVVEVITPQVIKDIQTSGLAGVAGSYLDIIKGTRTAAQDVLGVRGGLRFGVPGARVTVAGTERLQTLAGKLAGDLRLNFVKSPLGNRVLGAITPTGEGGILGSEDLLRLRKGLRDGSLGADEAADATRLVALDNAYRAAVQQARRTTGGQLDSLELLPQYRIEKGARVLVTEGYDPKLLNGLIDYLQGVKDPATLAGKELEAFNKIRGALDSFADEAEQVSKATGFVPPRRTDYFPQMRSDETLRWAERNPKLAARIAEKLKVDRTWFVGNFQPRDLAKGDSWFGHVLDDTDLNISRLNELARNPAPGSGFKGLNFDFFETDVLKVLSKYGNTHAQFIALQKTLGDLPSQYPDLFRSTSLIDEEILDSTGAVVGVRQVMGPVGKAEGVFAGDTVAKVIPFDFEIYDPVTGVGVDPARAVELLTSGEIKSLIDDTKRILTDVRKPIVLKNDIDNALDQLNNRLFKIFDDYFAGRLSPPAAGVLSDEVLKQVSVFKNELGYLQERIGRTPTGPMSMLNLPINRWVEYTDVVGDGFRILNETTAPNIAVRDDIADLFTNASRMSDSKFASVVKVALNDYIKFSKSYLVARPGFHVRNGLSNVFTVVAAGASSEAIRTGPYMATTINRGLKAGKTPEQIAESLVDNYLTKQRGFVLGKPIVRAADERAREGVIRALTNAINYSGSTGFGQFGEIAEAVGQGNRGFLQAGDPRNKLSASIGNVLQKSREAGTAIEDVSRFTLTWDGLLKGLTPQQAVARTNKYLIDYADYSKADKVGRLVFPFWTFMTRNAPQQLELMWTNPKVYAQYNALRRNLEDKRTEEEGGLAVPSYEKDRGVFPTKEEGFGSLIPGNIIRPGLPFEGGGENVLSSLFTNPRQLISGINPLFRAPTEAFLRGEDNRGAKFFTDAPIVPTTELTYPTRSKFLYLAQEYFSPTSPIRSIVSATPARRSEFLQTLLGMKSDPNDPLTQEIQAALQWGGLPFGKTSTEQEKREYMSRVYKLADKIEKLNKQEQAIKDKAKEKEKASKVAPPTGTPSALDELINNPTTITTP